MSSRPLFFLFERVQTNKRTAKFRSNRVDDTDEPSPFGHEPIVAVATRHSRNGIAPSMRIMPQAPECEKSVISALFVDNSGCEICREIHVTHDWFFTPAFGIIFDVLMELWDRGVAFNFVTVTQILRDRQLLEHCGGAANVTNLALYIPTAANLRNDLDVLSEKLSLRRLVAVGSMMVSRAHDEQDNADGVLSDSERDVMAIRTTRETRQKFTGKDVAREGLAALERKIQLHGRISGISTGFHKLDLATDGLHGSELIVVAALPALGKTSLCMQIAEFISIDCKLPIAVFSLEMSRIQFSERWITSRAKVNTVPWRYGARVPDWQIAEIRCAASEFHASPIFVEEASDMTIQEVRSSARSLVRAHAVKAIFIDSLSVMRSTSKQARDNRYREVSECINGCKEMAKELHVPVVVIAHLKPQNAENQRPNLNDLRESGNIAQDADSVWMLWQPPSDEPEENNSNPAVDLWIPKNRNGERFVSVPLIFQKSITRFREPESDKTERQEGLGI
jgi:replicative DNA helicase